MTEVERIVSRAKRGRLLFGAAIAVICAAGLAAGIFAVVVNFQQDTDITSVTQKVDSACESKAAGKKCQRVKREGDEARSIRDTCIAFWKVGYACPKPGSAAAERQVQATVATPDANGGRGEATAPVSDGSGGALAPGPGSDDTPAPQDPGSDPAPAPAKGDVAAPQPSPTASNPPSSSTNGGSTGNSEGGSPSTPPFAVDPLPEPQDQAPVLPATVEATGKAAGEVLDKAGGAVNGTVEGMTNAGCKLTGRC